MTDLHRSVWLAIVKEAVYLPQDGQKCVGRYIGLAALRSILRKSRRTTEQNALLWALYDDILERGGELLGGWTKDDLHEYFLGEHFGWEVHEALGMKRQKPMRRSSRLTKTEFGQYIDFIVRRMAEHGVVLKLPGDAEAA